MDLKTLLTIFHILGVTMGAGGAFFADYIFLDSVKNHRVSRREMSFIGGSSKFIWWGLLLLFLSGLGLFLLDPIKYSSSPKFLTKMIIVVIITLNGLIFHKIHIPNLKKSLGEDLRQNKFFQKHRNLLILSASI